MADWVRRPFTSPGLTQIPPGRYLRGLQDRFGGGVVMLCIDISGSMDGKPILEAVRGAKNFVREAVAARYKVGVMLWNTKVVDFSEPTADGKARPVGLPVAGLNDASPPHWMPTSRR